MLDTDGVTEVLRWDLINAWPSEWHGAPLDALAREVAIESLTLVFESLQRA
jgi:phage tail-like protein